MLRTPFNSSNQSYCNNQNRSEKTYGNVIVIQNSRYQWGVEDLEGNIIVPYGKYEWIDGFDQGLARVRTVGQITYTKNVSAIYSINKESKVEEITDPELIHQRILEDKRKQPGIFAKWGIINEQGEEVLPVEYDDIWNFFGKNRRSTKVVKDGVAREVYFCDLNPKLLPHASKPSLSYSNRKHYHKYENNHIDYGEETWWALTDGMYGDYPGHVDDYDFLGF